MCWPNDEWKNAQQEQPKKPTKAQKAEEKRMSEVWRRIKKASYEKSLDRLDDTAKTLVTLSSSLVTIGFVVIGTLVKPEILQVSFWSIRFALLGFVFFMCSAVSGILVIFRRSLGTDTNAVPAEIAKNWARVQAVKFKYVRAGYTFFGAGVVSEIIAMFQLVFL